MKGPAALIRSTQLHGYKNKYSVYEWKEKDAYLLIDSVNYKGKDGAVLCYYNPPVHQVGNPGLDAYLEGLNLLMKEDSLSFLILHGPCDPVHAGGDLKESLRRLDETLAERKRKIEEGASPQEIDRLFKWADDRLKKGIELHAALRRISSRLRVVATCGGGTRYGGSAEIPLMADYIVGDSRSGMCFSEAMIGLIPGWGGVARAIIKCGALNAAAMAKTAVEVKDSSLLAIGIYNKTVDISISFPRRSKGSEASAADFEAACLDHEVTVGAKLLSAALDLCCMEERDIPRLDEGSRTTLMDKKAVEEEVIRRKNPSNYSQMFGKPLSEVRDEIARIGRPLAPQSIDALERLLSSYWSEAFDENAFVEREMREDAALYRDPRFRKGLVATLEQKVADFREATWQ